MSVLTKEKQKNEVEQEEIAMEFNPEELEAVKEKAKGLGIKNVHNMKILCLHLRLWHFHKGYA